MWDPRLGLTSGQDSLWSLRQEMQGRPGKAEVCASSEIREWGEESHLGWEVGGRGQRSPPTPLHGGVQPTPTPATAPAQHEWLVMAEDGCLSKAGEFP